MAFGTAAGTLAACFLGALAPFVEGCEGAFVWLTPWTTGSRCFSLVLSQAALQARHEQLP